jgi:hypothetical protein
MADKKISALTGASTPLAGTEVLPIVQSSATVKVSVANLTAGRAVSAASLATTGNVVTDTLFRVTNAGQIEQNSGLGGLYFLNTAVGGGASNQRFLTTNALGVAQLQLQLVGGATQTNNLYGDTRLETGNLVIGTSGKGIDFSANTGAAGMTSELLNWYEEGTWTPTLTCTDGNFNSVTYDALKGGSYTRVGKIVHVQCYMRTDAVDNTVGRAGDVLIAGLPFTAASGVGGTLSGHCSLAVSVASTWAGDEPIGAFISGGDNNIQLMSRLLVNGNTSNITATAVGTGANANIVLIGGTYLAA